MNSKISMSVIRRMPRYYRFLNELRQSGIDRISSSELSKRMGSTASQIRQDFNCFGGFGQQGYGYSVPLLCSKIKEILGIDSENKCILIGAGNLGRAIIGHIPFTSLGFRLIGVFDNSENVIGKRINGYSILSFSEIDDFYKDERPVMAILCIPSESAGAVADKLHGLGIKSFWNFTHIDLSLKYPDAYVENVHLNDSMMMLCYDLTNGKG